MRWPNLCLCPCHGNRYRNLRLVLKDSLRSPSLWRERRRSHFRLNSRKLSPAEVSDRVTSEAVATSPELGGLESHDALSVPTGDVLSSPESLAASEPSPKIGEFSWASIFNSAWKFGSSSPAPHDSLHHSSPVESSEFAESAISQEAVGAPVLHEEQPPAVSPGSRCRNRYPMPGDQIQDAPVTISFADSVPSPPGESLGECTVAPVEISEEGVAQDAPVVAPVLKDEQTDVVVSRGDFRINASVCQPGRAGGLPDAWGSGPEYACYDPSADIALGSAVEPLVEPPAMPVVPINILDEAAAHDAPQVIAPVEVPAVSAHV